MSLDKDDPKESETVSLTASSGDEGKKMMEAILQSFPLLSLRDDGKFFFVTSLSLYRGVSDRLATRKTKYRTNFFCWKVSLVEC